MSFFRNSNRKTATIAVFIFVIIQLFVYASIPRDTDNIRVPVIVKNGTSLLNIAKYLKSQGVIYSSNLFFLTSLIYGKKLIAGEYELGKDMSTIDIVKVMKLGLRKIYLLRLIEGHNIYTIADSIAENGIMARDSFLAIAHDKMYLTKIGIHADSLEGYLTPDTYYFSREIPPEKFIEGIAKKTLLFVSQNNNKEKMSVLGLNTHQVLTLASMIEKEAKYQNEKPLISAVFHNRLRMGMSFDCDPTVIYGTRQFHSPITKSDLTTYTPYNTYVFKGFPKGPICNPSRSSITAALNPVSVDYLYFVSRNDGTHVFSTNISEHNKNVQIYQRFRNVTK